MRAGESIFSVALCSAVGDVNSHAFQLISTYLSNSKYNKFLIQGEVVGGLWAALLTYVGSGAIFLFINNISGLCALVDT